jgi:hypothetical protein
MNSLQSVNPAHESLTRTLARHTQHARTAPTDAARRPRPLLGIFLDAPWHQIDRATVCALAKAGFTWAVADGEVSSSWCAACSTRSKPCRGYVRILC